jgi:hypothetical protein
MRLSRGGDAIEIRRATPAPWRPGRRVAGWRRPFQVCAPKQVAQSCSVTLRLLFRSSPAGADLFWRSAVRPPLITKSRGPRRQVRATCVPARMSFSVQKECTCQFLCHVYLLTRDVLSEHNLPD